MDSVLRLQGVSKLFGKRKAVDNVSFEVKCGEVFGFLGPNGAGKTTTIKMIMGFLNIDEGEIFINDINILKNREKAMESIGGIVENPEMYNYLSGMTNLEMYARLHTGVTKKRIAEVVELCGMTHRINDKVKKYSLGMKQRAGLAQALLHKPKILILDEPTNGLDPAGIKELRDIIKNLAHEDNVGVLVSSHLLTEMELMCDTVGIINNGKLIGVKPIKQLIAEASISQGFTLNVSPVDAAVNLINEKYPNIIKQVGGDFITLDIGEDMVQQICTLLVTNGIGISGINKHEVSLEDAFIAITGGGNNIE
jgi:ABC-2 type transport system ATP-binding protein